MVAQTNKVAWNTAENLIQEIGRLRTLANTYYISKRINVALRVLSSMKMCVIHSLNEEEIKSLQDLENLALKEQLIIDSYEKAGFNKEIDKEYYDAFFLLEQYYRNFNNELQKTLEKYGYLIEKKEDKTVLRF